MQYKIKKTKPNLEISIPKSLDSFADMATYIFIYMYIKINIYAYKNIYIVEYINLRLYISIVIGPSIL